MPLHLCTRAYSSQTRAVILLHGPRAISKRHQEVDIDTAEENSQQALFGFCHTAVGSPLPSSIWKGAWHPPLRKAQATHFEQCPSGCIFLIGFGVCTFGGNSGGDAALPSSVQHLEVPTLPHLVLRPSTCPCHSSGSRLLSGIARGFRRILSFPSPSPETSHFSKEP